ncbi:MAG TPA: hypothetical protein VG733_19220, partial [Chthoniobacteraceae bacterium]|nr:hypothetical protein [Chthoniobacteraceae bacterium]
MQRQANTKSLAKLAVIPAAVALFFAARGTAHAQGALAVNLGPASFSTNWGAPQGASQYQPQAVQQRSYHARNTSAVPARQVA